MRGPLPLPTAREERDQGTAGHREPRGAGVGGRRAWTPRELGGLPAARPRHHLQPPTTETGGGARGAAGAGVWGPRAPRPCADSVWLHTAAAATRREPLVQPRGPGAPRPARAGRGGRAAGSGGVPSPAPEGKAPAERTLQVADTRLSPASEGPPAPTQTLLSTPAPPPSAHNSGGSPRPLAPTRALSVRARTRGARAGRVGVGALPPRLCLLLDWGAQWGAQRGRGGPGGAGPALAPPRPRDAGAVLGPPLQAGW